MAATIVSPGDSSDAKNKLMQLFEKDWQWEMVDNPEFACQAGSYLKYEDGTSLLQDVSPAGYLQRKDHSTEMLKELDAVLSLGGLNSEQLLLADLFAMSHNGIAKNIDLCKSHLYALNSTGTGCPTFSFIEAVEWMRFETIADYKLYLRRLNAFPVQMQMFIDSLHEGIRTGYTCSRAQVRKVASQVEAIIASQFAALREPLAGLLQLPGGDSGGSGGDNNALLDDIEAALRSDGVVANAFKMFLEFFLSEEMQSSLRVDPAVSALPNGRAIYAACLEYHTTTSLTADDIHALGLSEVARIETRYREEVLKPMGFEPDDFTAFVQHARSHPAYYVSNAEQLLDRYRAVCERIAHIMPTYFADIPASPLEITSKEVGPAAYYLAGTPDGKRPGRFYVNVSNISERPVYESVALSLHEVIPGHHHQISLAMENTNIPAFLRFIEDRRYEICPSRRNLFTGYLEGWALYCEYLGEEMGLYSSPIELFGRLSMEMMRAVRLVVDTGIHSLGWSLDRCVEYFMEKTGMHRHEAEGEVYRYASWPGQAVAYKVGQLEIIRLRRKAESELGALFDLKSFHAVLLNSGPMPLSQTAGLVDEMIRETRLHNGLINT